MSFHPPENRQRRETCRASRTGFLLTPRDVQILADVTRFGALTVEWIARRYFGSVLTAYGRLHALARVGYLRWDRRFLSRPGFYVVTHVGARLSGTGLQAVAPADSKLEHHLDVADLALWLLTRYPGATWISERELRCSALKEVRDAGTGRLVGGSGHVPDGVLVLSQGQRVAVEVERSAKTDRRYDGIIRQYLDGSFEKVWWFVRPAPVQRRLAAAVEREVAGDVISVGPYPAALVGRREGRAA